jgi:hypothetical protein
MPVYAEDIARKQMLEFNARAAGAASGVMDTLGYDTARVWLEIGDRVGTLKVSVRESDTVSGTYSGMTAITGFSAITITTSNTARLFIRSRPKRFMGVHVSNASASSVYGVIGLLTDGKRIPGSDTDTDLGFADIVRYPSGS